VISRGSLRGVPIDPEPIWLDPKYPDSSWIYALSYPDEIADPATVIAAEVSAAPSGTGELELSNLTGTATGLQLTIAGGQPKRRYTLRFVVTTPSGTLEFIARMDVDPLLDSDRPQTPPSTGFGSVTTWDDALPNPPLINSGRYSLAAFSVRGDGSDEYVKLQHALDENPPLLAPMGAFCSSQPLLYSSELDLLGVDRRQSIFKPHASMSVSVSLFQAKVISADGSLQTIAPRFSNLGFDGSARTFQSWLTTSTGTPITDPQADYSPGGVLAGASNAAATVNLSGGKVISLTITAPGSYVFTPAVIIEGDGFGARVSAVMTAGAVTSHLIVEGGRNYTTATARYVGGGAAASALITANRRNTAYATNGGLIDFAKCDRPEVSDCWFANHGATVIFDRGCRNGRYLRSLYEGGGQSDFVGSALWVQSYGSNSGQAYYAPSTDTVFAGNTVRNWARSALSFNPPGGGLIDGNLIDGFGESAIFMAAPGSTVVSRNRIRHGRITDIVCTAVEINIIPVDSTIEIVSNFFDDIDGFAIATLSGRLKTHGNVYRNIPAYVKKDTPYGPFGERFGFNAGSTPLAGTQRGDLGIISIQDADASPLNAPNGVSIRDETFIDTRGTGNGPLHILRFARGAPNAIGNITFIGNDLTQLQGGTQIYDASEVALCVAPGTVFDVSRNLGVAFGPGGYPTVADPGTNVLVLDITTSQSLDVLNTYPWVQTIDVDCFGPGAPGGGGPRLAAATAGSGGAGGAGGAREELHLIRADLVGALVLTIGTPGIPGAGATVDGTAGVAGTVGTATTVAIGSTTLCSAFPGGAGAGGGVGINSGGGGGAGYLGAGGSGSGATGGTAGTLGGVAGNSTTAGTADANIHGGAPGAAGINGAAGLTGGNAADGGPGGGSGGGVDAAGVGYIGGTSGVANHVGGHLGGAPPGGAGFGGLEAPGRPGSAGSGGGGNPAGDGGAGGPGGTAAGGGGGGAARGGNGGLGGLGGPGRVRLLLRG
jgi:hypothetical protein